MGQGKHKEVDSGLHCADTQNTSLGSGVICGVGLVQNLQTSTLSLAVLQEDEVTKSGIVIVHARFPIGMPALTPSCSHTAHLKNSAFLFSTLYSTPEVYSQDFSEVISMTVLLPCGYPSVALEVLPSFGSRQTPSYDPHLSPNGLLVVCKARGT